MRVRRWLMILTVPLLCPVVAKPKLVSDEAKAERESHIISIYEGVTETAGQIHGPKAFVTINRPKKRVTLVLASYEGVTWEVSATESTQIEKVILGGHKRQAVTGVPANVPIVEAFSGKTEHPLPYAYRINTPAFRRMIQNVAQMTELPISSFQGRYSYRHEDGAFVIDKVHNDPRLSPEYPKPTPAAELPNLEFTALHYMSDRSRGFDMAVSRGDFTTSGPKPETLKPLPKGVGRLAYDPVNKKYYGIAGHEVVEVDLEKNQTKTIELSLDVPRISWPRDVAYDTKRQRLILLENQYILAYEPGTKKWSGLCKRPHHLQAVTYSEKDDCFYGLVPTTNPNGRESGDTATIVKLNPHGAILERYPLGDPILPGIVQEGPGVSTAQVVCAGDYLVLLVSTGGRYSEQKVQDAWYMFLIDLKKPEAKLTYKVVK